MSVTSVYPTAIASKGDLLFPTNRASTVLTTPIGAGDLTINVASTALFPSLSSTQATAITIDGENIKVVASSSTTFTVPAGGRGFDGTTAAAHVVGAVVSSQILAIHHNQLAAEVIAIETALGINYANPIVLTPKYNFTAQLPGGSLTGGITNTITLTPVPLGVNATDTNHYLYISSGTGTAEAVLITGGTAVAGGTSGTITFLSANNHSGAWQIASATAGIQEALIDSPNTSIKIPKGNYNMYATIYLPLTDSIDLFGDINDQSSNSTVLTNLHTGNTINRTGNSGNRTTRIHDLNLVGSGTAGNGIHLQFNSGLMIERVWVISFSNSTSGKGRGIYTNQCDHGYIRNCAFYGNYIGVNLDTSNNITITDNLSNGNVSIGISITGGVGTESILNRILNNDIESNNQGIVAQNIFRTLVQGNYCENNTNPNYFGNNVTGVNYNANYHLGQGVQFDSPDGVEIGGNTFQGSGCHLDVTTFNSRTINIKPDNCFNLGSITIPASAQYNQGVVSAATTTLPDMGAFFNVAYSGTNISSITGSWSGRVVVLRFASAMTVTNGSNLKLSGSNFVATTDSTLTLICDNVNWYEIARSIH